MMRRLDLRDSLPVLVYPADRAAYARLCRLLTLGKERAGKGACDLSWQDLAAHCEGMIAILLPDAPLAPALIERSMAALRRESFSRMSLPIQSARSIRRASGHPWVVSRLSTDPRADWGAYLIAAATED
jgi:error-prone DNA polymerase